MGGFRELVVFRRIALIIMMPLEGILYSEYLIIFNISHQSNKPINWALLTPFFQVKKWKLRKAR